MSADDVAAAADLLRANGYAVVTAAQAEHMDRWLRESHDRECQAQDETVRALQMCWMLMGACQEMLGGSRPRWWRKAVKWRNQYGWTEPVVRRSA